MFKVLAVLPVYWPVLADTGRYWQAPRVEALLGCCWGSVGVLLGFCWVAIGVLKRHVQASAKLAKFRRLKWSKSFLYDFLHKVVQAAETEFVKQVQHGLVSGDLPWASGCTGTEAPSWAIEALSSVFRKSAPHRCDRRASAEWLPRKRGFAVDAAHALAKPLPRQIFRDIAELAQDEGRSKYIEVELIGLVFG